MKQERQSLRGGHAMASFVGALLLGGMLSGCWGPANDSMSDANGSGGANGGTGESAGGGPATGGETSGAGGTSTGGTMSQEEWEAATAPRPGPHEIWTRESCEELYVGSRSVRVGQEYSVIPTLGQSADFDPVTHPQLDVFIEPYCMGPSDCTEAAGGLCEGRINDAYCRYSTSPPREVCRVDADCAAKPNGSCEAPLGLSEYALCYPTGVCEDPSGTCVYGADAPCTSDADCTEREGGTCVFPVAWTSCSYDSCFDDVDCEWGERCACGHCAKAACSSDDDCGEGQTCELSPAWCLGGPSFHCTTPRDECTPDEEGCRFQSGADGYWSFGHCLI